MLSTQRRTWRRFRGRRVGGATVGDSGRREPLGLSCRGGGFGPEFCAGWRAGDCDAGAYLGGVAGWLVGRGWLVAARGSSDGRRESGRS